MDGAVEVCGSAVGGFHVEAERVDGFAVGLARVEGIEFPDVVAGLDDGAGGCVLAGFEGCGGGEARGEEEGEGGEGELHCGGWEWWEMDEVVEG